MRSTTATMSRACPLPTAPPSSEYQLAAAEKTSGARCSSAIKQPGVQKHAPSTLRSASILCGGTGRLVLPMAPSMEYCLFSRFNGHHDIGGYAGVQLDLM